MNIRKAELKDAKQLNHLLTLLIQDERKYDESIDESFVVTSMYEHYIEDNSRFIIVAEDNDKIIGYLYGYIKNEDPTLTTKESLLDALYIDLEYRNQGIANKFIEEFKKWSKDNNVNSIEVGVCSENTNAKNLYNKHGFKTTKETLILKIDD